MLLVPGRIPGYDPVVSSGLVGHVDDEGDAEQSSCKEIFKKSWEWLTIILRWELLYCFKLIAR